MKRVFRSLFLAALLLATGLSHGQAPADPPPVAGLSPPVVRLGGDAPGASTLLVGRLGTVDRHDLESAVATALPGLVARHFDAAGTEDLVPVRTSRDTAGRFHARFQQYLGGLEVVGAQLNVHVEVETGDVVEMNGRFVPDPGLPPEPRLAGKEALHMAMGAVGIFGGELLAEPRLTYLLPPGEDRLHLAWSTDVRHPDPEGERVDRLFADADDGSLLAVFPLQAFAKKRETYTANNVPYAPGTTEDLPGELLITEGGSSTDPVAQKAHENAGQVYDFHWQVFGRDSLDDNGETIKTIVHRGVDKKQAQFDHQNRWAWYGDGDGVDYGPFGNGLDVVAHEMQHGISFLELGLASNANESAALHEALSDMFAAAAEAWADGWVSSNAYRIGEDVYQPGNAGIALRYMYDPARDGVSKDFYPEYSSSATEHQNAGILNLAFYLLSQGGTHPRGKTSVFVSGIGLSKARSLVNDAYNYLFMSPEFEDFRFGVIQSAAARYGVGSPEHTSARNAFCAVGFDCSDLEGPQMFVDRPSHNQRAAGDFLVRGWAVDASGVTGMTFKLDGQPVTLSSFVYGIQNPGACNIHSDLGDPNCPYVGWQGTLDTTAFANGTHTLTATALDPFGQSTGINRIFKISNPQTQTFHAAEDAWVNELAPSANYGTASDLRVRSAATGAGHHTYLKFNVGGVSGWVQSAVLRIHTQGTPFPGSRVYYMVSNAWNEGTITWNNAPTGFYFQYPVGALPANRWVLIDVGSIVTGNGTYTIGLVAPDVPNLAFWSRQSSRKPTLQVTWVP